MYDNKYGIINGNPGLSKKCIAESLYVPVSGTSSPANLTIIFPSNCPAFHLPSTDIVLRSYTPIPWNWIN